MLPEPLDEPGVAEYIAAVARAERVEVHEPAAVPGGTAERVPEIEAPDAAAAELGIAAEESAGFAERFVPQVG